MVVETVVKNGKIVSPGGIISGGIAIQDGKILAVCKDSELPEANKTIDAGSNYILPGIVDVHVHADFCPYEGKEVTGWPVLTMLRGKVVVEDGKMVANPGIGKLYPAQLTNSCPN